MKFFYTFVSVAAFLFSQNIVGQQIFSSGNSQPVSLVSGKTNFAVKPFAPSFIENKRQFDKYDATNKAADFKSPVYGSRMGNTIILFKSNSIQFVENKYTHSEKENEGKEEKEFPENEFETYRQALTFVNANPGAEFIASQKEQQYFTYPDAAIKNGTITANGWKSLTIKNIYPGIDVDYSFHPDGGIKYSFTITPGADASLIKMKWSGVDGIVIDDSGNLQMNSQNGIFSDKAPVCYYKDDETSIVGSSFSVRGKTVSFSLAGYDHTKVVVIDPWVMNPNFAGFNSAFDIQHDAAGDIYVFGGDTPFQLQKYTSLGAPLWTYNTIAGGYYGDFTVDAAGNVFYVHGPWGDACEKISSAGLLIWSVVNPINAIRVETYRIYPNPVTGQLTIMGMKSDSLTGDLCPMEVNIDPGSGAYSPYYIHPACTAGEVRGMSVDTNGDMFGLVYSAATSLNPLADNLIWKVNSAIVTTGSVVNGYLLGENDASNSNSAYSGFNGTALSATALFTYDGQTVKKWNKTTLTLLNSVAIPGGIHYVTGGLCTDVCGNVYVGGPNSIMEFDSSLNLITSVATSGQVYDVNNGNVSGEILGCGQAFFGSYSFPFSSCSSLPVAIFTASDTGICPGACINFTNLSQNATSFQWTFQGGTPGSDTVANPSNICYESPGIYSVSLTATNASGTDTAVYSSYITVYPQPAPPTFVQVGDTLFVQQGYSGYQWYFGSNAIGGATNYFYIAPVSGNYNIVVTDSNGCSIGAGIINVIAAMNELNAQDEMFGLFPNPSPGQFIICKSQYAIQSVEIFNTLGEKVWSRELKEEKKELTIDGSRFVKGIYFVRVGAKDFVSVKKLVVE